MVRGRRERALLEGHTSLIRNRVRWNDFIVCSIFVNPSQFVLKEYLDKYPCTLKEKKNIKLLESLDRYMLFASNVSEMYS